MNINPTVKNGRFEHGLEFPNSRKIVEENGQLISVIVEQNPVLFVSEYDPQHVEYRTWPKVGKFQPVEKSEHYMKLDYVWDDLKHSNLQLNYAFQKVSTKMLNDDSFKETMTLEELLTKIVNLMKTTLETDDGDNKTI